MVWFCFFFFFQAEDGIRDGHVTGVQTCALPIFGAAPALFPDAGGEGGMCRLSTRPPPPMTGPPPPITGSPQPVSASDCQELRLRYCAVAASARFQSISSVGISLKKRLAGKCCGAPQDARMAARET